MPENEGRQWIVEPAPASGEVALYLAVGDGVDLTAEQEAALTALLHSLEVEDAEVVGHGRECPSRAGCSEYSTCSSLSCGKVSCGGLMCYGLGGTRVAAAAPGGSANWNLMGSFTLGAM